MRTITVFLAFEEGSSLCLGAGERVSAVPMSRTHSQSVSQVAVTLPDAGRSSEMGKTYRRVAW